jgi:pSer/pThr/pTyr-binding forkhead associated (FHA) protein
MHTDPVAVALKFGFLAVLYLFLLWVAWSALRDVAGRRRTRYAYADGDTAARDAQPMPPSIRPRLEVVAAMGHEPGTVFELDGEATLGRAATADVLIEDPFASSAHARIFPSGDAMYIEDLDSTNGTFLNERQLERPERLQPSDSIRVGDTEYRYQE